MPNIIPELDPDPEREPPNEWTTVERPLLQQLAAMGWEYLEGNLDYPQKTFRDNFRDVLLQDHLRAAVKRINDRENLDELTIDRAIRELERSEKPHGLDRNRELTQKLIKGVQVARATNSGTPHSRNVIVKAPLSAGRDELTALIKEKLVWIYQRLGRKKEELHHLPLKEFVSGEGFYYRGRKYRLKLLDQAIPAMKNEKLKFLNSRFWMLRKFASNGYDIFAAWYAQRSAEWVPQRVQFLKGRVGVESGPIEIRDIGFRWGSCTEKGKLFFHWRLILLPPKIIDYLILHELVHIHEHNHSPTFYGRLRCASPDYEDHEEWLRCNGDKYRL
jgi:predicted metal-dependent hydrolase